MSRQSGSRAHLRSGNSTHGASDIKLDRVAITGPWHRAAEQHFAVCRPPAGRLALDNLPRKQSGRAGAALARTTTERRRQIKLQRMRGGHDIAPLDGGIASLRRVCGE